MVQQIPKIKCSGAFFTAPKQPPIEKKWRLLLKSFLAEHLHDLVELFAMRLKQVVTGIAEGVHLGSFETIICPEYLLPWNKVLAPPEYQGRNVYLGVKLVNVFVSDHFHVSD